MRPIVVALGPRLGRLEETLGKREPMADVVSEIVAAQRALRDADRRLEAIEPPQDVEKAHEGMIGATRQLVHDLQPSLHAARCRNTRALELAEARRTRTPIRVLRDAIFALRGRGYAIPKLATQPPAAPAARGPQRPRPDDCVHATI